MRALVPHRGAVCRLWPSPGQLPQRQLRVDTNATTVSIHFIVTALTNLEPFLDGLPVTFAILGTFHLD